METRVLSKSVRKPKRVVLNVASCNYNFFMELMNNLKFVEVEKEDDDGDSREEIIAKLKGAANDIKLINAGKLEGRPLKDFLDEF